MLFFISDTTVETDTRYTECLNEESFLGSSNSHISIHHLQDLVNGTIDKTFPQVEDKSSVESLSYNSPISTIYEQLKSFVVEDSYTSNYPISLLSSVSTVNNVKERENSLLDSFNSLRPRYPDLIQQLSCFYRYHSASIEMERMTSTSSCLSLSTRDCVNHKFDTQILKIIDRVEESLNNLSAKSISSPPTTRSRPAVSRNSLAVLEEWYQLHLEHPYPTASQVELLACRSKLTTEQVKKWFGNKRSRSKNTRSLTEIAKVKRRQRLLKRI